MTVPDWAGYLMFRPRFAEVMDPALYTLDWLDAQVLSGKALFWRSDHAAILAEIKVYPTGAKELHGMIAAGLLGEIVNVLIPEAEQYAHEHGFVATSIASTPGWQRALKTRGYDLYQVYLRKEL